MKWTRPTHCCSGFGVHCLAGGAEAGESPLRLLAADCPLLLASECSGGVWRSKPRDLPWGVTLNNSLTSSPQLDSGDKVNLKSSPSPVSLSSPLSVLLVAASSVASLPWSASLSPMFMSARVEL